MKIKQLILLLLSLFYLSSCQQDKVELWDFAMLENHINSNTGDKNLKVINFWATWCAPCIKEMPYFEEIQRSDQQNVELLFVSLDHSDEVDNKVIPLLNKKNINSKVVLLTDENYNEWIDKIDPEWSGAIPATLFILADGQRAFYEKEFERDELSDLIDKLKPKENTL